MHFFVICFLFLHSWCVRGGLIIANNIRDHGASFECHSGGFVRAPGFLHPQTISIGHLDINERLLVEA